MGRECVPYPAQVAMPFTGPSPVDLDRIADRVVQLIQDDPNNPLANPVGMAFADMEQTASRVGQLVVARLTQQALTRHTEATATPEVACPKCAILCHLTRKKRQLKTAAGGVEYLEPASHCVDCRRDFFPSA
jgi:hypothetical protein